MSQPLVLTGPSLLRGGYTPPGDKSVSHRAVMFGALASGRSVYENFLSSEDCLHTAKAFEKMGAAVHFENDGNRLSVDGVGLAGLKAPTDELYLGNSGTSMRLLLGILAGQRFEAVLSGDDSLSGRPMGRVTKPLKQMGAQIKGRDHGNYAPLVIRGGSIKGIEYENRLRSAQVKSALLFAGLYAEGKTRIHDPGFSRDHTERFLSASGANFHRAGEWIEIEKTEILKPLGGMLPGDISSAAFFITAAAMLPGSELTVRDVGLNSTRTGFLKVLKRMGAKITEEVTAEEPEPMGTIHVEGQRLSGTRVHYEEIPSLIDELPVLMTAMALASGESLISGAEELRVKETDRIYSMVQNLSRIGARVEELPDGCMIRGVDSFTPGKVESFYDHRTVMSLAIASLAIKGPLEIDDVSCVSTSYPGFFRDLESLRV